MPIKTCITTLAVLLTLGTASSVTSWAEGNGTDRGGGDVEIDSDGHVISADPDIKRGGEMEPLTECKGELRVGAPQELVTELRRWGKLLVAYGAQELKSPTSQLKQGYQPSIQTNRSQMTVPCEIKTDITTGKSVCQTPRRQEIRYSSFIENSVIGPKARYCFVDELPRRTQALPTRPGLERKTEPAGYTEGTLTFLRRDLFVGDQMSVRQKTKFLIHERMHTLGNITYGVIADVTGGLENALDLFLKQAPNNLVAPSPQELDHLRRLIAAISAAGMDEAGRSMDIHPNGGGTILRGATRVTDQAFVGVGSVVGTTLVLEPGTVVIDSDVCPEGGGALSIETGATLISSSLRECASLGMGRDPSIFDHIGKRVVIARSRLNFMGSPAYGDEQSSLFDLREDSSILDSTLNPRRLALGRGAKIQASNLLAVNSPENIRYEAPGLSIELEDSAGILNAGPMWILNAFDSGSFHKEMALRFPVLNVAKGVTLDLKTGRVCNAPENVADSVRNEIGDAAEKYAALFPVFPIYRIKGYHRVESSSDFDKNHHCMGLPTGPEFARIFDLRLENFLK